MEYCDNLIFHRRAAVDELTERLLDANRTIGQPKKITMIFGRKDQQEYRGKLQTVIEDLDLPNPVIRSHYGHGFAKQYVRDDRILRTEPATNNVYDYGVKKDVENLPSPQANVRDRRPLPRRPTGCPGDLHRPGPTTEIRRAHHPATGRRIPGLKLDHPRQLAVMHSLVRFANVAASGRFTTADLYPRTAVLGATDAILAGLVSL